MMSTCISILRLLLPVLLLTGCVNYFGINTHKRLARPEHFPNQQSIPQMRGQWPRTDWANQFGDPQLLCLIEEALAKNPDLETTRARVKQARAIAANTASSLFPAINWTTQGYGGRLSRTLLPPFLGGGRWYTLGLFMYTLKYNLDLWGKNISLLRQALSEEKVSLLSFEEAKLSLATAVAAAYNQLAYSYALREVLQRTLAQRLAVNRLTALRLQSGLDTRTQIYQSRNTVAAARTELKDIEGQILLTRQQLGTLLGAGVDRGLRIKRPRFLVTKTPPLPSQLPLHLLGRRPDIVGALWRVRASCAGIANMKAQFYPDINLIAFGGFISFGLDRLFERASTDYQFGPALSLPIFDAGALRAQLRQKYGIYEEAVAIYNSTLNNALSDVAHQIAALQSNAQQIQSQKEGLVSAERAYRVARYQYQVGLTSQLVVLDTETRVLNERKSRLQLLSSRRQLQIALIQSLGGGFQTCVNH
ncbi:MAG: efflux transporter outer membrane subunit [Legionella sp.]|nr:efflux transporter outer membrane subunit [Legionella sp.]